MEVTFSMKELQNISLRCQEYTAEMDDLAREKEKKRLAKASSSAYRLSTFSFILGIGYL